MSNEEYPCPKCKNPTWSEVVGQKVTLECSNHLCPCSILPPAESNKGFKDAYERFLKEVEDKKPKFYRPRKPKVEPVPEPAKATPKRHEVVDHLC